MGLLTPSPDEHNQNDPKHCRAYGHHNGLRDGNTE